MRPGGFDFTPDGKAAIVATWNGDVWRRGRPHERRRPATLRWRRIASGLFQPLGVKFRGEDLFITCRDQIARLHDLNGDGETDFIENFNNDHQVTEHFHEFAMGLQTDAAGNFYYAKSARHALTGARAASRHAAARQRRRLAHRHPRHRLPRRQRRLPQSRRHVFRHRPGRPLDAEEPHQPRPAPAASTATCSATRASPTPPTPRWSQPMVWITNAKDRSPAELLWVPKNAWGPLGGSLLNLSYGTGRLFVVPHEEVDGQWQGAVCELPMPAFPTGIMRGRFGADGALYACGMFAWAGNASAPADSTASAARETRPSPARGPRANRRARADLQRPARPRAINPTPSRSKSGPSNAARTTARHTSTNIRSKSTAPA